MCGSTLNEASINKRGEVRGSLVFTGTENPVIIRYNRITAMPRKSAVNNDWRYNQIALIRIAQLTNNTINRFLA